MPDSGRQSLESALNDLRVALKDADIEDVRAERKRVDALVEAQLVPYEKSAWREYAESIGIAILVALFLRAFVVEAFKIPSGSMLPTLLIGDHLFISKLAYGIRLPFTEASVFQYNAPEHGDVVVFRFPREEARAHLNLQPASRRGCIHPSGLNDEKDMIKRVVAVAGDTIEIRKDTVLLNGEHLERTFLRKDITGDFRAPYETVERETNADATYTIRLLGKPSNFGPFKVKTGHVFVLGDNRNDSADSRCWGSVPVDHIKGKAWFIWWSKGDGVRWERFGKTIE